MAEDGFLSLQEGDLFPAPAPGRAFMSPSEFAGRGLAPGSVIALSRADRVDLCRVFSRPIAPGAGQPPEPHCFRLRAAAVPAGAAEIKPLSGAPTAERVVLRTPVVLGPDARSLMRSLLVGQPIARGFQLSYAEDYSFLWGGDGALLLEVASAAPAAACVVVGRRTNITFEPPADAPPPAADARGAQPSADGLSAAALALVELMALPHWHPRERPLLLRRGGLPRGLLLSGPPGVGKTFAVRSAVDHCRALFPTELFAVAGGELLALGRGAAEAALRDIFRRARRCEAARAGGCAVIFLDELDAFASKRDGQGGLPPDPAAARLAGQLLVLMDGAAPPPGAEAAAHTIVVGATNRPDALDAALRRPGRFDREIPVAAPAAPERRRILARLSAAPAAAVAAVARDCVGYVAADLAALAREAALGAHARGAAAVEEDDLRAAMARVGASALRALAASVPDTPWSAVGGAAEAKRRLVAAVEWPLRHAEAFQRLRLRPPKGLLLYGPPGCSKTTLARAAATASAAAFVALSGADVYSPFVGEAERTVRDAFATARRAAPCVLFFDEIDALVGSRGIGGGGGAGGAAEQRVLATFLNEMDGVESGGGDGVLVLGATNRPWAIDAALMRPGRFDRRILVGLPDAEGVAEILAIKLRGRPLADDVSVAELAEIAAGMTGAEIEGACRDAALACLREALRGGGGGGKGGGETPKIGSGETPEIGMRHLRSAFGAVTRAVTPEMMARYDAFAEGLRD